MIVYQDVNFTLVTKTKKTTLMRIYNGFFTDSTRQWSGNLVEGEWLWHDRVGHKLPTERWKLSVRYIDIYQYTNIQDSHPIHWYWNGKSYVQQN